MIRTSIFLTAALSLIMSALTAQSANIPISYLPFTISTPGTYVLTENFNYTGSTAINITGPFSGPVVLNLKGHTINGVSRGTYSTGIAVSGNGPNISSITIENGTITNFGIGVSAVPSNAYAGGGPTNFFSSISINNLVVSYALTPADTGACVFFTDVNLSTISNCTFSSADYGIRDFQSAGGNRYNNISFSNAGYPLVAYGLNGKDVLQHCQFAPPTN
jgi:nitrous oxidase accessory protein NosD